MYTKARGSVFQRGKEIQRDEETWIKLPNKLKATLKSPGFEAVLFYNGSQVWLQLGGQVRDITAQYLANMRESIEFDPLLVLWSIAQANYKFEVIGQEQVDGKDTQILRVTNDQGKFADFYFDVKQLVPLKIVQAEDGKQVEKLLRDYRQVEGFWYPFSQKTLVDKELANSLEILEFKVNTGVGDEQFEKPVDRFSRGRGRRVS